MIIEIDRGEAWSGVFIYTQGDVRPDLTGYLAHFEVRDVSGALLLALSIGAGVSILGTPEASEVHVRATAAQVATLPGRGAQWALELTDPDGGVLEVQRGEIVVRSFLARTLALLMPSGSAFALVQDSGLKRVIEALGFALDAARDVIDQVFADLDPERTTCLADWEAQFALADLGLTESQRRVRLAGAWQRVGGQSPAYIQSTLRAAGFDVYVHEPYADMRALSGLRDPGELLGDARDITSQSGAFVSGATVSGAGAVPRGRLLANSGEVPLVPTDSAAWPFIFYIGAADISTGTSADLADVPASRVGELESLLLQIRPAQMWVGLLINEV